MRSPPLAVLALSAGLALLQGATSLTFVRPAAQGPGTPGYGVISDPTISAALSDGVSMDIGLTALIDLEGNGRPDLVGCHGSGPPHPPYDKAPCRVMRSQPDGSMVDVTRQLFGGGALPKVTHAREFLSGDFNRDGRQDIFIAAHGYDAPPWGGETNVLLLSNPDGTYSDRSTTLPQAPDFSHSACVGDINGDSYLDIYVGNQGGSPIGPYFLVGRGDGTFTQKITGLPPLMSAGIFDTTLRLEIFMSCLFADVDQDGAQDLVLGTAPNVDHVDSVVLFNDGTGDFTTRPRFVLPHGALPAGDFLVLDIASLDINRDGRPDLVLLHAASHAASGFALQVLITQSNGTLVDETSRLGPFTARLTGPWFPFLHLADFNGDGWEDLYLDTVYQDDGASYARIWLSNGNGTWSPVSPGSLPAEFSVRGKLHAVDFDGDGRPDILRLAGAPGVDAPDIGYNSFLNRTPRTVPSEPIIGGAIAHNSRALISFTAPLATGASAITGYTATCGPGLITAVGGASPISVTGLTNGRHYSCAVTATNLAGVSTPSAARLVTPFVLPFIDDSLAAGATSIKAAHITELRTRINAARAGVGLAAFSWTDGTVTAGSSAIRSVHITELRTALTQAYGAAGITAPVFTDSSLIGVTPKALHITEIRAAILVLE